MCVSTYTYSSAGLRQKDIEDLRSLLVDTNFYFLLTTIFVSVIHVSSMLSKDIVNHVLFPSHFGVTFLLLVIRGKNPSVTLL